MRTLVYIAVAVLVAGLVACDLQKPSERSMERGDPSGNRANSAAQDDEEPVAIVNGEVVTHAEFERRIQQLAPFARARLSSVDKRKEFLESVVQFEVLADEAEKRGYGDDPAVLQAMKDVMVRKMIQEEVRERVSMSDVSDDEVEQYYREHKSEYQKPESRRAAVVMTATEEEARMLRDELVQNRPDEQRERVLEVRRLAAKLSLDREAASEGGDVGWIPHPDAKPERIKLAREIFALEAPGEVTEPFRLRDNWAIATYFEKRSASTKTLDDVRESIRETLYQKKKKQARDAFVAELREDARIERYEDVLESVDAPEDATNPTIENIPTVPIRDLRGERGAAQSDDSSPKTD